MNKKMNLKKVFFLPLFLMFFCFAAFGAETVKILAIGNSFSEDAVEDYLYKIAKADGTVLVIGNMYIAGCDLARHWNNADNNSKAYAYRKINAYGEKIETRDVSIEDALLDENWDYITFQQASQESGLYDTYFPYISNLVAYVKGKATNPDVKYGMHMTWAYEQTSTHSGFANYGRDQMTMYNAILETVYKVAEEMEMDHVIPAGTAVQNGRTSFVGDTYCRDGYHLDYGIGRYTVSCTWYQELFGNSVLENSFIPDGLTNSRIDIARKAAHYAVENPLEITSLANELNLPEARSYVLSSPINIDFGIASRTSADPWNNITSVAAGTNIHGLSDMSGEITPIKIEIVDPFGNINQNGPTSGLTIPDWDLPADASYDSFWGNSGDAFEGKNIVTASVLFSELNPDMNYDFKVFSSRPATDIREMEITVQGENEEVAYINSSGNTTIAAVLNRIIPKADGTIKMSFTAGPNNNNNVKFYYVNAIQIAPSKEEITGTLEQSFYFDFGYDNHPTTGPDGNGNYWNNIMSDANNGAMVENLITNNNTISEYTLEVTKKFSLNDSSPGGLTTPEEELLGDFAIPSASRDYFFVEGATGKRGEVKIKKLNSEKGYRFYLFGSRAANSDSDTRTTIYTLTGLNNSYGTLQTTGMNIDGEGSKQNLSKFFVSDMLLPDANGEIIIEVSRLKDENGQYAYLGMMRMEEYDISSTVSKATDISISVSDITVSGETPKVKATITPANAIYPDINWSIDNEDIAWIDQQGIIHPKKNGVINVTATIQYEGEEPINDTQEVTISNQITELYFVGSASERGEGYENAIPLTMITDLEGTVSNIFEIYTKVNPGGTFRFATSTTEEEAVKYGGNYGSLTVNGEEITITETVPVRIRVNLTDHTYSVRPVYLNLVGSAVGSWNLSAGIDLSYQGDGIWSERVTFNPSGNSDPARFVILLEKGTNWNYTLKEVKDSFNTLIWEQDATTYGVEMKDIYTNMKGGTFDVSIDLRNYTYSIDCIENNDFKISMMGSSVANGQGATNMQGYAYLYGQLLNNRYQANESEYDWQLSNISVNGNNTGNLLDRWSGDLLGDCSRYVIYGLSLGNEGIHENGQSSFDSFHTNMNKLIQMAIDHGKYPVMSNSYTRGDFNEKDYAYVKQMNLLVHEWDIPSINLLGAIDNGAGVWADGYQVPGDIYHPNTDGHNEFFYAIVPSLFDALEADKPQPQRVENVSYKLGKTVEERIELVPENVIHSYTLSFDFKTASTGVIATGISEAGVSTVILTTNGIEYTSPSGEKLDYEIAVTGDQWHKVTLTHYYAWGKTMVYMDNEKVGELDEKTVFNKFYLGDENAPDEVEYAQLHFYRSAMNAEEVEALNKGKMLKSSLEIYAPLDENSDNPLVNLAQSNNTLILDDLSGNSISKVEVDEYPKTVNVYSIDGRRVATIEMQAADIIPQGLSSGFYVIDNKKVFVK